MKKDLTKNEAKTANKNRGLLIFVCIFLVIVLIFGAIMLTVTLIRQSKYAVKYNGDGIDVKTATYFATYYKYRYVSALRRSGVNAQDTEVFWNSIGEGNEKSYGEYLKDGCEKYLKEIIVAVSLYDRYGNIDSKDEERIDAAIRAKLEGAYLMDGTKDTFNSITSEYGFDYRSFANAAEMLYKASRARALIFGTNGEVLSSMESECNEYLSTYSHVRLLFVHSEQKRVEKDGISQMVDMTDEEKTALANDLFEFDSLIENGTASGATFNRYFDKYNTVVGINDAGEYYLNAGSAFTEGAIRDEFPNVVSTALSMKINSIEKTEYSDGVCYIYRYSPAEGAYKDSSLSIFFEDFYFNASTYLYSASVDLYSSAVELTDRYYGIDVIKTPYYYDYFITNF